MKTSSIVLATASGPDAPGITSQLTGVLAQNEAVILDIGQAVIHHLLSLSILFELSSEDTEKNTTIKDLLYKASELGLTLHFKVIDSSEAHQVHLASKTHRHVITLIGNPVSAAGLHKVTHFLEKHHINIDRLRRLSDQGFTCVELSISSQSPINQTEFKAQLLTLARENQIDIGLQVEGLFRRSKRLVVFDMDSTLIQQEVIDELARFHGVFDEVAQITHSAMEGKLDYDQSFQKRCALLKGLKEEDLKKIARTIDLTPGAKELIHLLKKLGYKTALISGGFERIAKLIQRELGIDFCYANPMDFQGGVFTGKAIPPIINAQRKADLLDEIVQKEGIHLNQVMAVGDGANDLLMLEKAGLGVAFNAKATVNEQADLALRKQSLQSLLYLLGIPEQDILEWMRSGDYPPPKESS